MINKKVITIVIIIIILSTVVVLGVFFSNFTQKPAEPASASGTYVQNIKTEGEQSNCCTN